MCLREKSAERLFTLWEKMKPILPSLREKKRYVVFKVISDSQTSFSEVRKELMSESVAWMGELMFSRSGLSFIDEWNPQEQLGIVRINRTFLDHLRSVFCLVDSIGHNKAIIRSLGASGTLKGARRFTGG